MLARRLNAAVLGTGSAVFKHDAFAAARVLPVNVRAGQPACAAFKAVFVVYDQLAVTNLINLRRTNDGADFSQAALAFIPWVQMRNAVRRVFYGVQFFI